MFMLPVAGFFFEGLAPLLLTNRVGILQGLGELVGRSFQVL